MKFEITQKGVYDKSGKRIPVGKVLTLKGDKVPSHLVGKGRDLTPAAAKAVDDQDDEPQKSAVTNPKMGD